MKFRHCNLNYLNGDMKLHKKEVFISGIFIHQPFIFNQKLISVKVKNIFHSFESQHFKYKCWLFFITKIEHQ
jgi:hypothetical protein